MRERRSQTESSIEGEVLSAYAQTFIPHWDCYSIQHQDGRYRAVKQPLTLAPVEAHLRGQVTLGAYALDPDSQAKWLCLDADTEEEWGGLVELARMLRPAAVVAYLEQSRRGGHLWMFTPLLSGAEMRRFGRQLLVGYSSLEHVELYPKQDRLVTGPGSLVRLPLGVHRKTGKRYTFVTPAGDPLAPTIREQLRILAEPERVPTVFIADVLKHAPEPKPVFPTRPFEFRSGLLAGDTPSARIKHAISVYDSVRQYVQLDRGGKGVCPFHDDQWRVSELAPK